jgi:hypothetical protein
MKDSSYLMNLEQVLILEHVSDTGGNGNLLPGLECLLRVFNG